MSSRWERTNKRRDTSYRRLTRSAVAREPIQVPRPAVVASCPAVDGAALSATISTASQQAPAEGARVAQADNRVALKRLTDPLLRDDPGKPRCRR